MSVHQNPVVIARLLFLLGFIALMVSPPLANLFLFLLLLVSCVSGAMRTRLLAAWREPMVKAAAAFCLVMLLGVTYSAGGWAAGLHQTWAFRGLSFMVIGVAIFDDLNWKRIYLQVVALSASLAACAVLAISAWQAHVNGGFLLPVTLVRNYVTQGLTFAVALLACFGLLALDKGRRRWLWWGCSVPLLLAATLVTQGRSGYLVLLVGIGSLVIGMLVRKGYGLFSAVAAGLGISAIALALLVVSPVARERIALGISQVRDYATNPDVANTSMGLRMGFWHDAIVLAKDRPLFGWGTGSYAKVHEKLMETGQGRSTMVTTDPHNQYLKIAVENGAIGLAALLALFIAFVRQRAAHPFRTLGLAALAGWCATSLANAHLSTFQESHLLFMWLGVMLGCGPGSTAMRMQHHS